MTDVHDSLTAAGARAVPRCMEPTVDCPSMLQSARLSSCSCPAFEVHLCVHVAVIPELLQLLTKSFQQYHYH